MSSLIGYEKDDTTKVDRHVEAPINNLKVVFLEFIGLVFDPGFILEDKLEGGR